MTQERKHPITCQDLIGEGKWIKHFCCSDCHAKAGEEGEAAALIHETLEDRRYALLCCRASVLLHPSGLPLHELEYAEDPQQGNLGPRQMHDCRNGKGDGIALCEWDGKYEVLYRPDLPGYNGMHFECVDKEIAINLYKALQHVSLFALNGKKTAYCRARKIDTQFEEIF